VAGEIDPLRVVNDAIENGVSVGGIADQLMPFVDRDLAGDDRRSPTVAFFEDFEEVVTGGAMRGRKRCRLHGGRSPGAPRGRRNGNYTQGDWTAEALEERRWVRDLVRAFCKSETTS
jgi:hypothetical protein